MKKYSHRSADYDASTAVGRIRSRERAREDRKPGFNGVEQGLSSRERQDPDESERYPYWVNTPLD